MLGRTVVHEGDIIEVIEDKNKHASADSQDEFFVVMQVGDDLGWGRVYRDAETNEWVEEDIDGDIAYEDFGETRYPADKTKENIISTFKDFTKKLFVFDYKMFAAEKYDEILASNAPIFFVVIDDGEGRCLGRIEKDGGKWHETRIRGEVHNFGTKRYMSYLDRSDVLQWLRRDYDRVQAFNTLQEAERFF